MLGFRLTKAGMVGRQKGRLAGSSVEEGAIQQTITERVGCSWPIDGGIGR
jgi:hypothetical protein